MPANGQLGTAKDGTPVVWVESLGRAVPVSAAKSMGVQPMGSGGGANPAPKLAASEQKTLADLRTASQNARSAREQAEQFGKLNREVGTGGIYGIPGVSELVGAFDPKVSAMQGLSNAMIPGMHMTPGPMTDADAKLYKSAIPNPNLPGPANKALRMDIARREEIAAARAAYFDRWAARRGTLNGAEQGFNKWLTAWRSQKSKGGGAPKPAGKPGQKSAYRVLSVE